MILVSKFPQLLLLISCLLVQACKHANEEKNEPKEIKTDLAKAASYNVQLGLGYLKQGDRARAKKKFLTALEQAPNSAEVNGAIAYYFEQTKEMERARKHYLKAISLSSNAGAQLNNYGAFLCREGDYAKAESYFLKAVDDIKYVNTAGAYENAGLCALDVPNKEKAKYFFNKALDQDPSRKQSLYELVILEVKANHDAAAFDLLQKYPELVQSDKVFLTLAKDISTKLGKYEVAAEYENNYRKMEAKIVNSGVSDEYSTRNG